MELGKDDLGRRPGLIVKLGVGIMVLAAAVLGYGAWHAHTHASVWLQVKDHAGRTPQQLGSDATDAQLDLHDAAGKRVVEARLEPPLGLARYSGPQQAAVDCPRTLDRTAWGNCWARQSRWIAQWAPRVSSARVSIGRCVIDAVPVHRRLYTDWWLWWVPLPHVGGTPTSHYTVHLHLDSARCAVAQPPTDP